MDKLSIELEYPEDIFSKMTAQYFKENKWQYLLPMIKF